MFSLFRSTPPALIDDDDEKKSLERQKAELEDMRQSLLRQQEELSRSQEKMEEKIKEKLRKEMEDETLRIQKQRSINMDVLHGLMKQRIIGQLDGYGQSIADVYNKAMETFVNLSSVDVVDLYSISRRIIWTNSPRGYNILVYIICRDSIYITTIHAPPCGTVHVGSPKLFYTFHNTINSIQESILVSLCQTPVSIFDHREDTQVSWEKSAKITFESVIRGIPGVIEE